MYATWLVISTNFSKTKDVSRSQAVTYTVDVVISRNRCQAESFLLLTTNRKLHTLYGLSNRGSSDVVESPSRSFTPVSFQM